MISISNSPCLASGLHACVHAITALQVAACPSTVQKPLCVSVYLSGYFCEDRLESEDIFAGPCFWHTSKDCFHNQDSLFLCSVNISVHSYVQEGSYQVFWRESTHEPKRDLTSQMTRQHCLQLLHSHNVLDVSGFLLWLVEKVVAHWIHFQPPENPPNLLLSMCQQVHPNFDWAHHHVPSI